MEIDPQDSSSEDDVSEDDTWQAPLVWPYAKAFSQLKSKDTFLYTLKCLSDALPPRIHIGRKAFAWPLSKAQEKRLNALYDSDTVLPASDFSIDDFDSWWTTAGENILIEGRDALGIESSVAIGVTLSHLAIDVSGNGDVLRAQETAPNTFGSVIFVLPSTHKGGRITFTQGHHTEKFYAASSATVMHAAMTYLQTSISSTRLSSGRRYALVFNLVSLDGPVPCMPPKMLEAIEVFKALAARPIQKHRRIARALKPINASLSWDKLSWADTYLVDVLLATGAYDVALVRFRKAPQDEETSFDHIDDFSVENEADCEYLNRQHENNITSCVPHPACSMSDVIVGALKHQDVHAFPDCARSVQIPILLKCSPTALVFWPIQYRAEILGIDIALPWLRAAIKDPTPHNLIGFATAQDMAVSVLATFGCGTRTNGIPTSYPSRKPDGYTEAMADVLLALNDGDLVETFLRDAVWITANTPVDDVAPVVHTLLDHFGWPALADAMLGLVHRWLRSTTGPLLQLVLSLAGRSARPVCAKLQQPYFGEWLKAAWSVIVLHPRLKFRDGSDRVGVLRDLLLLDAYVTYDLPTQQDDNYLSGHLPPALITDVDGYLHGGCHVVDAVQTMYTCDTSLLVPELSEALVEVLATYPAMELEPFTNVLFAAYNEVSSPQELGSYACPAAGSSMSPWAFGCFLVVLDLDGRCDTKFTASLWAWWGLREGPSLDRNNVDKVMPSVSAHLQKRVTTLLVHAAPALAQLHDKTVGAKNRRRGSARRVNGMPWDEPTKRGLAVLATMAPKAIPAFTAAWLAALPPTIEATRDLLFPIVEWMHRRLKPTHHDTVSCLASKCLERLQAARVRVRASPAFVMSDIYIAKEHCAQCHQVAKFLRDNTKAHVVLTTSSYDVCSIVRNIVAAHKDRLKFATDEPTIYMRTSTLIKRTKRASAAHSQNDQVHDDCRIVVLERIVANDPPPTKRPRFV